MKIMIGEQGDMSESEKATLCHVGSLWLQSLHIWYLEILATNMN